MFLTRTAGDNSPEIAIVNTEQPSETSKGKSHEHRLYNIKTESLNTVDKSERQPVLKINPTYYVDEDTQTKILEKYTEKKADFYYQSYWAEVEVNENGLPVITLTDLNTFTPEAFIAVENKFYYEVDEMNQSEDIYGNYSLENEDKIRNIISEKTPNISIDFLTCRDLRCMLIINHNNSSGLLELDKSSSRLLGGEKSCSSFRYSNGVGKFFVTIDCT
ncbi:hypothetical protein GCM10011501_19330 [Thalassotalea profundi]|uniref:Uncharacterized protein n=2 Tax=Thalassotalea profundi TaxID=2036687 RepID=A0ABQ3INU3_9GAMM|nr:hypothetical protein GCM10011501_19330 [Thalassotalea profundi]